MALGLQATPKQKDELTVIVPIQHHRAIPLLPLNPDPALQPVPDFLALPQQLVLEQLRHVARPLATLLVVGGVGPHGRDHPVEVVAAVREGGRGVGGGGAAGDGGRVVQLELGRGVLV